MYDRTALLLVTSIVFISPGAMAQSAAATSVSTGPADPEVVAIAECVVEKDAARHEGVTDYSMDLTMMGHEVTQFFEKTTVTAADGVAYPTYRLVPPTEIGKRTSDPSQQLSPEALQAYAKGLEDTGAALEREMTESGLPVGTIMNQGPMEGEEPWASPNPRVMMGAMAKFARGAAEAEDHISDGRSEAATNVDDMSEFFNVARKVGTEQIDGKRADHVRAEGLNKVQRSNNQEFVIQNASMWFDSEECVPLKFKMEGTATSDGQSREMLIEGNMLDYRPVPNSNMYESYRQVMRMGGVLSPEEMAQMAQAKEQLAEFDKQLASMPPSQQAMMKKMMGSQMDMVRKMVDTGAFEFETIVRAIRVNEGVAGALGHSGGAFGMMTAPTSGASGGNNLVQIVQQHLQSLGYDPGNTSGDLTKETVVAISKFQASKGMEVTGQATPQLAGILSAAVDAQN